MKLYLTLCFFQCYTFVVLAQKHSETYFNEITHQLPKDWNVEIAKDSITITRNTPTKTFHCGLNPVNRKGYLFDLLNYQIIIKRLPAFSPQEIEQRKKKQSAILDSLQNLYEKQRDYTSLLHYDLIAKFECKKNTIDSIRVPYLSQNGYSYFFEDNLKCQSCIEDTIATNEIEHIITDLIKLR